MGKYFSRFGKKTDIELAILGLDGSGKTTILYHLKRKDFWNVSRTVGYNLEKVRIKGTRFNLWDIGGLKNIRPLWKYHFAGKNGIIFVIDCADPNRLEEALSELRNVTKDQGVKKLRVLVFANKQDKADAIKSDIIEEKLMKDTDFRYVEWKVVPVCALAGHGLKTGLMWFKSQRRER